MRTLLFLFVLAGAPDAGVANRAAQRRSAAAVALENCRAQLPSCKVPWTEYVAPPHPCANRGAACPPELMQLATTGGNWICGCDACANDVDCGKGKRCGIDGVVDPCAHSAPRQTRVCLAADAGTPMRMLTPCVNLPPVPEAGSPVR
ncbi:MAG: hypothetical protein JNM17_03385 [Archangium sp.]|nr:hypothetical protein [Archangium sp.]